MYSDHELLLPAYLERPREMTRYVLFVREGANVRVNRGLAPVPSIDGNWAVLGQLAYRRPT
jgi:hypothetical protein